MSIIPVSPSASYKPWLSSCLTALDPPWWMPPFHFYRDQIGHCWQCNHVTFLDHIGLPLCIHCLANCPIWNEYIRCEHEASLLKLGLHPWMVVTTGSESHFRSSSVHDPGYGLLRAFRQVDLAQYASQYTNLIPAGPGVWKGCCPIHNEKTPSFRISANPWRWHCFGACATGGNIIDLIRELRRIGKLGTK